MIDRIRRRGAHPISLYGSLSPNPTGATTVTAVIEIRLLYLVWLVIPLTVALLIVLFGETFDWVTLAAFLIVTALPVGLLVGILWRERRTVLRDFRRALRVETS